MTSFKIDNIFYPKNQTVDLILLNSNVVTISWKILKEKKSVVKIYEKNIFTSPYSSELIDKYT